MSRSVLAVALRGERWLPAVSMFAVSLSAAAGALAPAMALQDAAVGTEVAITKASNQTPELTPELLVAHEGYFTGDVVKAERTLTSAIEASPASGLVLDAVLRLWSLEADGESEFTEASTTLRYLELAERVTDAEASYWLRRLAHRRLSRTRYSPDALTLPDGLYADFITQWHVVGPLGAFDAPVPGVGTAVAGGPAEGLEQEVGPQRFDSEFIAADGEPRRWVPAQREAGSAFVPLAQSIYPLAGLTYAVAFVRGPEDAQLGAASPAVLELRCSGAIRAWWNGRLAVSDSDVNPFARTDRYLAGVELQPGWNALLVRVPTSGASAVAARVLFERAGGALRLDEPQAGTSPSDVAWGANGAVGSIPSFDPQFPPLSGPFAPAMRALRAIHARRYDAALAVAAPAEDASPTAKAAFRLQRLAALDEVQHVPEELGRRQLLGLLDEIEGSGIDMADARWTRFRLALGADRPIEALELAESWVAAAPDRAWPLFAKCLALAALDPRGAAPRAELRALLERFPRHLGAREMLMGSLRYEGANLGALELAWGTLMAFAGSTRSMDTVLETLGGTRDPRLNLLLERAMAWREQHPGSGAARRAMEELVEVCADPSVRLAAAEERAQVFSMRPDPWSRLSKARLAAGDRAGALSALRRGLQLRPGNTALRDSARRLGQPDPAEAFFAAFAPDVNEAQAAAESFGDTSVIEALDLGLIYYFDDGSFHSRSHTLTIPTDRVGADSLLKRPASEDTQAIRVLRQDGRVLEPALTEDEWVLPSLEIGDVIEEVWDRSQVSVKGRAAAPNSWRFASFEKAFAISRWVVFVPEGLVRPSFEVRNFDGTHEEVPFEGGTVHVFTDSQDRQVPEPLMPSYGEILPLAGFGEGRTREGELRAWAAQVGRASSIPADLEEGILGFVSLHGSAADPMARARDLYAALDARLQSFEGDEDAASVWLSRRGWPLYLLGAIYERAEVPFRWVALEQTIAPELNPEPATLFAGERALSRAVIRVGEAESGFTWIVPGGSPGLPFGLLDDNYWGVSAWELGGLDEEVPGRRIVVGATEAQPAWDVDIELTYRIQADGSALVDGKVADASPGGIVSMRRVKEATMEQREGLARNQAAGIARGVDVADARVILDGSQGDGVVVTFEGAVDQALEARAGERLFRLPFLPLKLGQRFGPAARTWPLALRSPARLRCTVTVRWPEGLEFTGGPAEVQDVREGFEVYLKGTQGPDRSASFQQIYIQRGAVISAEEVPVFVGAMARLEAEFIRPLQFAE